MDFVVYFQIGWGVVENQMDPSQITEHVVFFNVSLHFTLILNDINVGKTMINHPFGNVLYNEIMVIWGMVYYCFTMFYPHEWISTLRKTTVIGASACKR